MDAWTGGRAVVELLKAEGVHHIFGIVGATFLDVLDALYDDRSVEYLNVRHEQAAAFMADGLARVTDRPAVCLVTSGPGATNLMTGVAAAYVAHSPVVVLVGGIALDHYQKDAFQEYDLVSMFRPVTKLALQINKAERIPGSCAHANPLYLSPLGRAGAPEAAAACRRADLVLAIGSRLGQFTTQFDDRYLRPETALVQIDIEGRDIGRYYPLRLGIQADAKASCEALLQALGRDGSARPRPRWRQETDTLRAQRQARLAAEARLAVTPMKPQRVYAELRRVLPPETIVTLDAGAAPAYGYDRLSFARPRTFLTPLDLGGLGFAFPAALGAKLGRPESPVLAVHGDGGFLMNAQEIETAVRHGIAVVTLIMNSNCWGSEKAYQKHFYNERYIGCDIGNPRYDQFARLFGAAGYYVDHPDQVGDAIKAAIAADKPAIVEIPIDPNEFPTPVAAVRKT